MWKFGVTPAIAGLALVSFAAVASSPVRAADALPAYISAAVADPGRVEAERAADADRLPGETLAFAGLKPGDRVADFLPGRGYFTKMFSNIVGSGGRVYAFVPDEIMAKFPNASDGIKAMAANPAYGNTVLVNLPVAGFKAPEPLDMVWTSRNYHDLKNKAFGGDIAAVNKAVFAALKPGGIYIVLDHAAAAGAPADVTETLHRVDPATVRQEVTAAGFVFEAESKILAHAEDDHTSKVFDAGVRGKTDQFILKFRKPKS